MKLHLTLLLALLISLSSRAQTDYCTLTGDIKDLGNHLVAISYSTDTSAISQHHITVRAHHGHFVFRAHLDAPVYAMVMFMHNHKPIIKSKYGRYLSFRSGRYRFPALKGIILENRSMYWHGTLDSINYVHIENAPMNDTLTYYWRLRSILAKSDTALSALSALAKTRKLTESQKIERAHLSGALHERTQDSIAAYVSAHPSSIVSASLMLQMVDYPYDKLRALYDRIDPSLYSNSMLIHVRQKLDRGHPADVSPGTMAPDIMLKDTAGRDIALSSLRGKYVLLDFWASWCGGCRLENPNLLTAYRHLHSKGLEIYSVSLDTDRAAWLRAIQKDKLPWIQVSDLIGWQDKASGLYGVIGIPANFLIDPTGKIIARDIRGKKASSEIEKWMK